MPDFAFEGPKWPTRTITWAFAGYNYSSDTPFTHAVPTVFQPDIQRAFNDWSLASGLTFQQVSDSPTSANAPDIRIGFDFLDPTNTNTIGLTDVPQAAFFHSDEIIRLEDPTERPLVNDNGTLIYQGTVSTFFQIALHEIGHALGLAHSSDPFSVMFPQATQSNRDLDASDRAGVTALYGVPSNDVSLHGLHTEYRIASNPAGGVVVVDTVGGRDGSLTLAALHDAFFIDGIGRFDATGNAEEAARLYQAALSRAPDAAGLEFWTAQLDSGALGLSDVAMGFVSSAEFNGKYGSLDNASFVQQLYQNVLHRSGDPGGLQFWTAQLNSGVSRGRVLIGFSDSLENKLNTQGSIGDPHMDEAYRLYQGALDRAPDLPGLGFWTAQLDNGATSLQVAQGFVNSSEFTQLFAGLDTGGFVDRLYDNVLHRAADASGKQFWTAQLNAGVSKAQVLLGFSDSLENRLNTSAATHDGWVYLA